MTILQWSELTIPPKHSFTTRRIDENLKADIFIARDDENFFLYLCNINKIFGIYLINTV